MREINQSAEATALSKPPLAYTPEDAARVTGRSRTRIFLALKNKEMTGRKDGRATLLEHDELQRWLRSMPTTGRNPEPAAA